MGGAALAHRPHGQVAAPRRLALPRPVRPRRADRRRHQRHRPAPRRRSGPLLYVVHAVWIERRRRCARRRRPSARIGVLTLATSLWWIAGLWAEGRYGLPVIRYTETYRTVATVSSRARGAAGPRLLVLLRQRQARPVDRAERDLHAPTWRCSTLSYAIPLAAIVAAAVVRWRYRALFLTIVVVGALTAIAAHPWDEPVAGRRRCSRPSPAPTPGSRCAARPGPCRWWSLGLRPVPRRRGVGRWAGALPRLTLPVTGAGRACVLFANLPTLWTGEMVAKNLQRPEDIPAYWQQAADYLQTPRTTTPGCSSCPAATSPATGGATPSTRSRPGLMDRGYVGPRAVPVRLAPVGRAARRPRPPLPGGHHRPRAIAPIARVMGAGDVVDRSDLQYERFRIARPRQMWDILLAHAGARPGRSTSGRPPPTWPGPSSR